MAQTPVIYKSEETGEISAVRRSSSAITAGTAVERLPSKDIAEPDLLKTDNLRFGLKAHIDAVEAKKREMTDPLTTSGIKLDIDVPMFPVNFLNYTHPSFISFMNEYFDHENYRFYEPSVGKFGITVVRFFKVEVKKNIMNFKQGQKYDILCVQKCQGDYEFCAYKTDSTGLWKDVTNAPYLFVGDVLATVIDPNKPPTSANRTRTYLRTYAYANGHWWLGIAPSKVMFRVDCFSIAVPFYVKEDPNTHIN